MDDLDRIDSSITNDMTNLEKENIEYLNKVKLMCYSYTIWLVQ